MIEGIGLNIGNGNFVVDRSGNLTLNGSITWGKDTFPVQSQFSVDGSTNWHSTQTASDKYRRDKQYDGTWGTPYQFRGTNGSNGSDASVTRANIERALKIASTTSSSYIGVDSMGSPEIYGGKIYGTEVYASEFNVYPLSEDDYTGSYNIYGMHNEKMYHFFTVKYQGNFDPSYGPNVYVYSPQSAVMHIGHPDGYRLIYIGEGKGTTAFRGSVDLSECTVSNWGNNYPYAKFA